MVKTIQKQFQDAIQQLKAQIKEKDKEIGLHKVQDPNNTNALAIVRR
jgi:hypothetical protein